MSKVTFFQAKRSHCLSSSSVLGAGSLYVVSSTIIQMVSRGSHHVSLPAGPPWLPNPSDTMLLTISHTVCEKTAIHSLVCLLRSLLLTTFLVIVQTSSTIWRFCFSSEWPEDHKNRCLSSSTNSVGLHFHEGVEKIKENDKNTKIENLQNGREKPRVRVQLGQKLKKIIISSNFSLKLL